MCLSGFLNKVVLLILIVSCFKFKVTSHRAREVVYISKIFVYAKNFCQYSKSTKCIDHFNNVFLQLETKEGTVVHA